MTAAAAAAPHACADCPWRLSNQGRHHPDGWYTKRNRDRLWAGLRRGVRMTCHPTDPDNPVPPGWRTVPIGAKTRECTGALILQQRELQVFNDMGSDHAAYRRARPRGMTLRGLVAVVERVIMVMPWETPMARPDLDDADVGHEPVADWHMHVRERAS